MQKIKNNKPFKIYECCFIVNGASRACIYDIQRGTYKFIPIVLYYILKKFDGKTIADIKLFYNSKYDAIIDEYFISLFEDEYIFFCSPNELVHFKKIKKRYENHAIITNAIIEGSQLIFEKFDSIIIQLTSLGCSNIHIVTYDSYPLEIYGILLKVLENSSIKNIQFIIKYHPSYSEIELFNIAKNNNRIGTMIVHSAPQKKTVKDHFYQMQSVFLITEEYKPTKEYRIKDESYFNINISLYMEAQFFNPYFNKKVAITRNGDIKNCITLQSSYGNINIHQIKDIVMQDNFQEVWKIRKDEILVCKTCEFRYMCCDNRVPIKSNNNYWQHNSECYYNPITCSWKEATNDIFDEKLINLDSKIN